MAQNNRPDKGKQSRNKKPEKPYVEQIDEAAAGPQQERPERGNRCGQPGGRERQLSDSSTGGKERKLVSEVRQEFEHPRKLHQKLLEPAEGTYPFPARST